eukprot:g33141.t1
MLVAACPALEETDAAEPEDLVTTNFVLRCKMLNIGGEAGLKVLGDALEPASAAPVNLSKVAKAIEARHQDTDKDSQDERL